MSKRARHDLVLVFIKVFPIGLSVGAFALCWYLYYSNRIISPFFFKGDVAVLAIYAAFYLLFAKIYDAFRISVSRPIEILYSQFLAFGLSDVMIYLVICLLAKSFPWLIPGIQCFVAQFILNALWAFFAHWLYFRVFPAKKSLIIYEYRHDFDQTVSQYSLNKKYDIRKVLSIEKCLKDPDVLEGIEVVFFSGVNSHDRNIIMKQCVEKDITSLIIPRVGDVMISGARQLHMFNLPILRLDRYHPSLSFLTIKRLFDIILSLGLLILFSPVMLITAAIIHFYDGGPALYKQNRLTKNGKVFRILKFRSMRQDAEKDGVARLSSGDQDERITPVGRYIRKVRFDELPQLINILKGDMSFIGPRPERPEIAAQYEEVMPEFHLRLQAKAGLTGYAQVYGKYNTTPYDKLLLDLIYIAHPSLLKELEIFFATIKILFMSGSTEGVAIGQETALEKEDPES